jgi:hypothetical protein
VIPPADVLEERYTDTLRAALEEKITEEILAAADLASRVEDAYSARADTIARDTADLSDCG